MSMSTAFHTLPSIIIAPPLSGCSTLASMHRDYATAIDYERNGVLSLRGASLKQRRLELARHVDMHHGCDFVCLPCLPKGDMLSHVAAVVLLNASDFVRRLLTVPMGQGGDGLRVAAAIWRDEAVALAARYDLPVFETLDEVPLLAHLTPTTGIRRPITQRISKHAITSTNLRPQR